jgi:hypothetical protein
MCDVSGVACSVTEAGVAGEMSRYLPPFVTLR